MKTRLALTIVACAVILSACAGGSTAVQPLHVEGTTLMNADSQTVALHGISIGWHNLWPRFYNAGAVRTMHDDWGCNLFRAAIGADDLDEFLNGTTDHPGYISDPEGAMEKLYAVVDEAIECGAYVIVDWHSHKTHLEEASAFFSDVANRYKGVPNVIYELFNEPVSTAFETEGSYADLGNPAAMQAYWEDLKAYAEALIEVITSIDDSKPLILMGSPCWDQRIDLPAADPITCYDNLMYTMHFYAATHKESLREASDRALKAGLPLFISECASMEATGNGPLDLDSWKEWSEWADANSLNIVCWSLSDKDESCSMLTPEAISEGPWPDEVIKPWGAIAKEFVK